MGDWETAMVMVGMEGGGPGEWKELRSLVLEHLKAYAGECMTLHVWSTVFSMISETVITTASSLMLRGLDCFLYIIGTL